MTEENEILICCLCNYTIEHEMFPNGGYMGNNPAPFGKEDDRCCDWCNSLKVTPARLGLTGEAAEKMGRALVSIHAVQQHIMKEMMKDEK